MPNGSIASPELPSQMNDDDRTEINPNLHKNKSSDTEIDLASKGNRLFASFLDSLAFLAVIYPFIHFTNWLYILEYDVYSEFVRSLIVMSVSVVVFLFLNLALLIYKGQTLGKAALHIKMVDVDSGLKLSSTQILKRYSVYFLIGLAPTIGPVFLLINVIAIFGNKNQCGHDIVAHTVVVNCDGEQ